MAFFLISKSYLSNLLKLFKDFIKQKLFKEIPLIIDEDEVLVRGIVAPFFVSSKNKLKREAFLPKNADIGVSLLRLEFATSDFCKDHTAKLNFPNNVYKGLGTINRKMIDMLNLDQAIKETAFLKGSPMGENMDYRQTENQKIYKNDPGLPMHADLFYYNQELEIGTVQTKYRQYANELAKMASYYEDPTPHINGWNGEELTCKM